MSKIKNSNLFKIVSIVLIATFVSLDISWAYPPEYNTGNSTLATPSLFQQQPITQQAARFQQSIFSQGELLGSVCSIGKYLLEDKLPIKHLEQVISAELGKAAEGIDLSHIIFKEGVVLIPYEVKNQRRIIQIALKDSMAARDLIGYEWVVSDKYVIKEISNGYKEPAPKIMKKAERPPVPVTEKIEKPAVTISEPIAEVNVSVARSEQYKGITSKIFNIKEIIRFLKGTVIGIAVVAFVSSITALPVFSQQKEKSVPKTTVSAVQNADEKRIRKLIKELSHSDSKVRAKAAVALGYISPTTPAIVSALLKTLKDRDKLVRGWAVDALGAIGPVTPEVIPAILKALEDSDAFTRYTAARALEKFGVLTMELKIKRYITDLEDRNSIEIFRLDAIDALEKIGPATPAVVTSLIKALLEDDDIDVRQRAIYALGSIKPATPEIASALIKALKDNYFLVRSSAVFRLGRIGPVTPEVIPAILKALEDSNDFVRAQAASALEDLGLLTPELRARRYISDLADTKSLTAVRNQAAYFLGMMGPVTSEVIPSLIKALDDGHSRVRDQAAASLGKIGPAAKDALPKLKKLLTDEDADVRKTAEEAIRKIENAPAPPAKHLNMKTILPPVLAAIFLLPQFVSAAEGGDSAFFYSMKDSIFSLVFWLGTGVVVFFTLKRLYGLTASWKIDWLAYWLKHGGRYNITYQEALVKIGAPTIPTLIELLNDNDSFVRSKAITALDELGWQPPNQELKIKRLFALQRWGEIEEIGAPAVPILEKASGDNDRYVRIGALEALDNIKHKATIALSIKELSDDNSSVRHKAATTLHKMGLKPLSLDLEIKHLFAEKKWETLTNKGIFAILILIEKGLGSKEWYIRSKAAETLGNMKWDKKLKSLSITPLIKAMSDKDSYVRRAAAEALDKLEWEPETKGLMIERLFALQDWDELVAIGHSAIPILKEASLKDINIFVRDKAKEALQRIKASASENAAPNPENGTNDFNSKTIIIQELVMQKEISHQQLFALVQSKVPESMQNLRQALDELKPLSEKSEITADTISQAIAQAKEKYSLSADETKILWLALTGPGQGIGKVSKTEKEVNRLIAMLEREKIRPVDPTKIAQGHDIYDYNYNPYNEVEDVALGTRLYAIRRLGEIGGPAARATAYLLKKFRNAGREEKDAIKKTLLNIGKPAVPYLKDALKQERRKKHIMAKELMEPREKSYEEDLYYTPYHPAERERYSLSDEIFLDTLHELIKEIQAGITSPAKIKVLCTCNSNYNRSPAMEMVLDYLIKKGRLTDAIYVSSGAVKTDNEQGWGQVNKALIEAFTSQFKEPSSIAVSSKTLTNEQVIEADIIIVPTAKIKEALEVRFGDKAKNKRIMVLDDIAQGMEIAVSDKIETEDAAALFKIRQIIEKVVWPEIIKTELQNIIFSITQELKQRKVVSIQDLFSLVYSNVPKSMQSLRKALAELKSLSEQMNVSADTISQTIAQTKEKYSLSYEETRILWLALTGPGQGMGENSENVVDLFIKILRGGEYHERKAAAWVLEMIMRDSRVVEPLINIISQEKDDEILKIAAKILGNIKDPRAVEPLIGLLYNYDYGVRSSAIQALGEIKDPRAIKPLLHKAAFKKDVGWLAKKALIKIGAETVPFMISICEDNLVELPEDKNSYYSDDYIQGLYDKIEDSDRIEKLVFAIDILGEIKDPRPVELLIKLLKDKEWKVLLATIKALGEIKDPRAVEPLLKILGRTVGPEIFRALGNIKDVRAIEPIANILLNEHVISYREVKEASCSALGDIGIAAVPVLIRMLAHHDRDRRIYAAAALCHIEYSPLKPMAEYLKVLKNYDNQEDGYYNPLTDEQIQLIFKSIEEGRVLKVDYIPAVTHEEWDTNPPGDLEWKILKIDKPAQLNIEIDEKASWQRNSELAYIKHLVSQELTGSKEIAPQILFSFVQSLVPSSMPELINAMKNLEPLSEQKEIAADAVSKAIAEAKVKYGLSYEETRILWLALTGPGQGRGERSEKSEEKLEINLAESQKEPDNNEAAQLFKMVEWSVNSHRVEFIKTGNDLIGLIPNILNSEKLPSVVDRIDKTMPAAVIRREVEHAIKVIETSKRKKEIPSEVRDTIAFLKKNMAQFEADSGTASIIVLARRAKREDQKLIIGLETDWIPGMNVKENSLQKNAITALMREIDAIGEKLKDMGLDNVEVIRGNRNDLAGKVLKKAEDTHTDLRNVVVMASIGTIKSESFRLLWEADRNNRPFFAAIDPTRLIKSYKEYKEATEKQIYVRLASLLYITLELAAGKEPPQTPLIRFYDSNERFVVLLPRPELKDYEELRNTYAAEKTALSAA